MGAQEVDFLPLVFSAAIMGNSAATAHEKASAQENVAQEKLQALMSWMHTAIKAKEDQWNAEDASVAGGGVAPLTVMTDVRAVTSDTIDKNITDGIADFFKAAQGGADAKSAAIDGAKNMVLGVLTALLGTNQGSISEQEGKVTLFMNFAFVEVRYDFNATGQAWLITDTEQVMGYTTRLTVLDIKNLRDDEINFLMSQALPVHNGLSSDLSTDLALLGELKSQMLLLKTLKLTEANWTSSGTGQVEEIVKVATEVAKANAQIQKAYEGLTNHASNPQLAKEMRMPPKERPRAVLLGNRGDGSKSLLSCMRAAPSA